MAQFLRDLWKDGYNGVKPVETIIKRAGLGQQIKDVASAELAKNGPRVLFYKQLPTLYGSDLVRISSKGSVDPARTLAVKGARPNKGGVARFLGNLLGGSANRPSDTIFPRDGVSPPVSRDGQPVNQNWDGLRYAVEAGTNYLVSQEPAGKNALTGLLKGNPSDIARNAIGAATAGAKQAVGRLVVNALTSKRTSNVNKLKEVAAGKRKESKFLPNTFEEPGSKFIKLKNINGIEELVDTKLIGVRVDPTGKPGTAPNRDYLIDNTLLQEIFFDDTDLQKLVQENTNNNLQYIQIKVEGKPNNLLFPAAVTDIQDNMSPEWTSFKYVGSPFNNYRYTGVERKMNFDFRVYWIDNGQQLIMQEKLNLLRELVYPDSNLTTIELNNKNEYKPIIFTPNIIQLSIGNLYKNLKGFVSNLSITVPQDAPWATSNPNFLKVNANIVYPTFVDVSFEMTLIENHTVNNNTITYRFTEADKVAPIQALPTQPVSSVPVNAADYGYNDIKLKPQLQRDREIGRQADFANNTINSQLGSSGVYDGKMDRRIVKWDYNKK